MKKYLSKLFLYAFLGSYIIFNFGNQKIDVKTSNVGFLSSESDNVILSFKVIEIKDFKYPFNEYIFYKDNTYSVITYNNSVSSTKKLITGNEIIIQYNADELMDILNEIELEENITDLKIKCENCNIWKGNTLESGIFTGGDLEYQKNQMDIYINNTKINNENKVFEVILNYPVKGKLRNKRKFFLLINDGKLYQDKNMKKMIEFFSCKMIE